MKPNHSLLLLLALFSGVAHAQLKTGSNPTSVAATSNFEVEATNGNKFIIGKATGAMTFIDGNQAAGKVLTSDAGGNAAWASPSAQLPSIAITSLTVPNTYPTGTMVYNTTAVTDVPAGPVIWNGSTWLAVGSQNSNITLSGTVTTGYDLTGLSSHTYDATGRWVTSGSDSAESTDGPCDFPSAQMATAMSALPDGGIIKIKLPSYSQSSSSYFDLGLPEASPYVGKVFYMYIDWTQTASASGSACYYHSVIPASASDAIHILGSGSTNAESNLAPGTALTPFWTFVHQHSSRPKLSVIVKILAISANEWTLECNVGTIFMPN